MAHSWVSGWVTVTPAVQVKASLTSKFTPPKLMLNGEFPCVALASTCTWGPKPPVTPSRSASAPPTTASLVSASGFCRSATATASATLVGREPRVLGACARALPAASPMANRSAGTVNRGRCRDRLITSAREDGDVDGHARGQPRVRRYVDPGDLHGHPLNDLHEVARSVVGRKKGEARPGAGRGAVDLAFEGAPRVGVDLDLRTLPRTHRADLGFLEVGQHVGRAGYDGD